MSAIAVVRAYNKTSQIEDVNPPKITPIEKAQSVETITTYFDTKTGSVVTEVEETPENNTPVLDPPAGGDVSPK